MAHLHLSVLGRLEENRAQFLEGAVEVSPVVHLVVHLIGHRVHVVDAHGRLIIVVIPLNDLICRYQTESLRLSKRCYFPISVLKKYTSADYHGVLGFWGP